MNIWGCKRKIKSLKQKLENKRELSTRRFQLLEALVEHYNNKMKKLKENKVKKRK